MGVATFTIGLVSIGIVAAPASAASGRTLATGSLHAISCDEDVNALTLFSIDAATAAATAIGDGAPESEAECALQAAWNPVTSTAYYSAEGLEPAVLTRIDPKTGDSTPVGMLALNGERNGIDSMAIGNDGAAYAIQDDTLYSLDLDTAALTKIAVLGTSALLGFSVDPTTGLFYAIRPGGQVFTIDVVAGTATLVGIVDVDGGIFSLQIDRAGVLWMEVDSGEDEVEGRTGDLWSADLADLAGSSLRSGTIADAEQTIYIQSLLYIPGPVVPVEPPVVQPPAVAPVTPVTPPAPKLANTGVDAAPIAAGGALVAMLGLALLVPAIRRRRANV
ncbi:hypothetical protein TZ00_17590 [Agreia bicolorata]|uniref:LPXTG-motif cell wall anchor domain-containing protein n=1 Tax=Agreia bicolorata TaxID=110935 RepID=A0ABR5CBP4_9MICO|nr:hypothetical protein TZ00_17590 [Agreia bicolorata]